MKIVYIGMGIFFLVTGLIGLFLPIFPTVPFLLMALICFMKASERFRLWVRRRKFYKKHFMKYEVNGQIPLKTKIYLGIISLAFAAAFVSAVVILLFVIKNNKELVYSFFEFLKETLL